MVNQATQRGSKRKKPQRQGASAGGGGKKSTSQQQIKQTTTTLGDIDVLAELKAKMEQVEKTGSPKPAAKSTPKAEKPTEPEIPVAEEKPAESEVPVVEEKAAEPEVPVAEEKAIEEPTVEKTPEASAEEE